MTVVGLRTVWELRGISCLPLELVPPARKSIIRSRSFGRVVTEKKELEEAITRYVCRAAEKLRQCGLVAHVLQVFITTGGRGKGPHYTRTCAVSLPRATNFSPELVKAALVCLERIFKEDYRYKKAGVVLLELAPEDPEQGSLFWPHSPREAALMKAVDAVNRKVGPGAVFLARAGTDVRWAMRREMMSPRYTTRLEEVPVAYA